MTRRARIADILYHASQLSGVSVETLLGKSRTRPVSRVRQAICLIAREQLNSEGEPAYSYPTIGRAFGGRDHSTIIHACGVAENMVERDPVFAEFVDTLREIATTSKPFAGSFSIISPPPVKPIEPRPEPLIVPERAPHIKKITLKPGEEADAGHEFHEGIGIGSAKLLRALAA